MSLQAITVTRTADYRGRIVVQGMTIASPAFTPNHNVTVTIAKASSANHRQPPVAKRAAKEVRDA